MAHETSPGGYSFHSLTKRCPTLLCVKQEEVTVACCSSVAVTVMDWPTTAPAVLLQDGPLIGLLPVTPARHLSSLHVLAMH